MSIITLKNQKKITQFSGRVAHQNLVSTWTVNCYFSTDHQNKKKDFFLNPDETGPTKVRHKRNHKSGPSNGLSKARVNVRSNKYLMLLGV